MIPLFDNYLHAKNLQVYWSFLQILMIKESCDLTEQEAQL